MSTEQDFEAWWQQHGQTLLQGGTGTGDVPAQAEAERKQLARAAYLAGRSGGESLYAWVGEDGQEKGVARLKTAWIPLGTINLVGFDPETLADPRLQAALQKQANEDGQTVRLFRFVKVEEMQVVEPRRDSNGKGR